MNLAEGMNFELRRTSKHIAVLINGSKVESLFVNKYAQHAEELALSYFITHNRRLKKPRLYITRKSPVNKMSRPCRHCCGLLKRFPQIRVFYTDEEGNWIEEKNFDTKHISYGRLKSGLCHITT
jgi:cytidine deaminase